MPTDHDGDALGSRPRSALQEDRENQLDPTRSTMTASVSDLASGMKSIGSRLARAVNRVFGRTGPVLADRSHLHVLRTPREVRNAIAYVLMNARRHAAKLGRRLSREAGIDPASSGRWFAGWRSAVAAARDVPAVAEPRTWLLLVGWLRAGRIDPGEIPGG